MLNLMVIFDTSEFVYFQTILDMIADMKLLKILKIIQKKRTSWITASVFHNNSKSLKEPLHLEDQHFRITRKEKRTRLVTDYFQGAGSDWWKHLHYQHHAKPNVVRSIVNFGSEKCQDIHSYHI